MKKILSLFMLLVATVTGAWAAGYEPSADEVIILNDVVDKTASTYSSHAAVAWGGSPSSNSKKAGDPNNIGSLTSSNVPCYSAKGNGGAKNITLSITGVSKIYLFHEVQGSRYVQLRAGSKTGTIIGEGTPNTNYTEVDLDGDTDYSIFLHGTGTGSDDQDLYIYAIKLIKATPAGPAITTQPQSAAYATGDPISPLTVEATASAGTLTYKWYSCDDAEKTNASAINGATSASYTPSAAGFYFVNVKDANGNLDSDVAQITISEEEAPTINVTGAPADDVVVGTEVILTATTTGTPTPTVTWYDGDTDEEITTGATYTVPTDVAGTFSFYAVASNGVEPDATSAVQTVVVKEQVAKPTLSPNGGYFQESQEVAIATTTEDATIQYSTDGGSTWIDYTEAFTVTETTTVQAKAVKAGYIDSETATATFTLVELTPQADVTEDVTWDWSTVTNSSAVDFTDTALSGADVTYANISAYGYTAVTGLGNEAALLMNGQRAYNNANSSKHCQVNYLKFNTIVPGSVTVEYANTGGNAARTINVNGTKGTKGSESNSSYQSESFDVEAGEVTIMGVQVSDDAAKMVRIRKVVFTADNGKEDSDLAVDPAETSVNMEETTDVVYTTSSTGAVTVETSDATVATATVDEGTKTITITGVAAGTATITVSQESDDTYNAGSQEIAVTVINPNIKYVYDVTGLTNDEFILTKDNIGTPNGLEENNQFVLTSTSDFVTDKTYGGYSGDFYNMSKPARSITFKVQGAENFRVLVQNSTSGRQYTVKVGNADAVTVTHDGGGVEMSDKFETGSTDEVTITFAGVDGSVYPVAIQFNIPDNETISIPEEGVLTYVTQNPVDFSSIDGTIKAYVVTATSTTSATTAEVAAVPAGTPLLIKGVAGDYDVEVIESASAPATNLLQVSDGTVAGGDNIYAYSKSALKFKKVAATVTIPEGKCYLEIDGNGGDALDIIFDGEATFINDVNAGAEAVAPVKVLTAKGVQIGKFNVAGQQVK